MIKFHVIQAQIKIRCPLTLTHIHFDTCKKCCFHNGFIGFKDIMGNLDILEVFCKFGENKKIHANYLDKTKIL